MKDLSWLSTAELTNLVGGLAMDNFKKHEVILGDARSAPNSAVIIRVSGLWNTVYYDVTNLLPLPSDLV